MFRACVTQVLVLAFSVGPALPGVAQVSTDDWTDRPDAHAPADVGEDRITPTGSVEIRYNLRVQSYDGILVGTTEVSPVHVTEGLQGELGLWDVASDRMVRQWHELELRTGLTDWLGASLRVPFVHTTADFVDGQNSNSISAHGLGDVEAHLQYGLHESWPHRAHLNLGVSLPTGAVDRSGALPNAPDVEGVAPYPFQPGAGTFQFLPGAVFASENAYGTVGFRMDARVPFGRNDRDWKPGAGFSAQTWMAYRFNDWVSGSMRVKYSRAGNVDGQDPDLDPWSTPMAHPDLQAGTRVKVPIGMNVRFAEGPLRGNRLYLELLLPLHHDLDGPQVKSSYGLAASWGVAF